MDGARARIAAALAASMAEAEEALERWAPVPVDAEAPNDLDDVVRSLLAASSEVTVGGVRVSLRSRKADLEAGWVRKAEALRSAALEEFRREAEEVRVDFETFDGRLSRAREDEGLTVQELAEIVRSAANDFAAVEMAAEALLERFG